MHLRTACRLAVMVMTGAFMAVPTVLRAAEDTPATAAPLGPWIFASVALVLVAAASYAAGRQQNRHPSADRAAPAAPAPRLRPTAAADGGAQALQDLAHTLTADARPLLLIEQAPTGDRRLRQANAAALQLLGLPSLPPDQAWAAVEAAAPPALRQALAARTAAAASGPDAGSEAAHDWWLLADSHGRWCLALGPRNGAGGVGGVDGDTASLVYAVSHDLRAPIRVVEGFARIVKEDYGSQLDRVGNDHLDRVLAAGARMNQMIDAVLAMARLASQPLGRQPVDLSQLAGYVVDELRRAGPERDVEVLVEPALRVYGDPTLLRLVLENLIGNAWKYSAKAPRARIEFGAERIDGRRVFAVRDNGAGFDMRVADRLFGLFQRLHSAKDFPGTGVGLASVRRVVQRHGGQVWAESAPGRGAAFFFTLAD